MQCLSKKGGGIFAILRPFLTYVLFVGFDVLRQYTLALRLKSQLFDLRAVYANHFPHFVREWSPQAPPIEKDTSLRTCNRAGAQL